ncbi:MAG: polysaccharide biosynthesis protein [Chthoniobacterales bacterium]
MRFLGPTSTPLLNEETGPMVRRALARARIIGNFASVQVIVQLLGFASGILLVRYLSQREYAYFTIANTMQGTINVLADIGISIGLISIGGRVWQDRARFGQLITTARHLRWKLCGVAVVIVTPILFLMLERNGAPLAYSAILITLTLAALAAQISYGVYAVVPRLRSDISRIQAIEFSGALVRIVVLIGCAFLFLNSGVALLVSAAAIFLQLALMRRYVANVIDLHAPENAEDRSAMVGFIKSQAANAIFFCVQGQITIFLISFFGTRTTAVAEIGALGRLAMIFAILGQLLTNIFVPAFARSQTSRRIRWQFAAIMAGVIAFGVVILSVAAFFPDQFLYVLGAKYAHLHREMFLMVAGTVANVIVATLWTLNAARAWIKGSWLYIPTTLATQIALIPYTDFSSVVSLLIFNLLSTIPNLLVNLWLSYRGFRHLDHSPATA